jgi:hypothetical protein
LNAFLPYCLAAGFVSLVKDLKPRKYLCDSLRYSL